MKRRLLFVYLHPTSFVQDDRALLEERYDVRTFHFDASQTRDPLRFAGLLGRQLRWLLRELPRADAVAGWFVDYHMALPVALGRRFSRPVAVFLGGNDCNWLPELGYGVFDSRWRAPIARYVHRHASLLLPVTETLMYSENRYSQWPARRAHGAKAHVPRLHTPYEVIPFGFDLDAWPMGPAERAPVVCTVGYVTSERTLKVKGVDLFIEAARRLPDATFQVIGVPEAQATAIRRRYAPPENVALLPPQPRADLSAVYGQASVYAQLSRTEGLPNVLCEAMCCGCVPVGSPVFGIPEIIGDAGFVLEAPDPDHIAQAIRRALEAGPERRQQARQRMADQFSRDQRRQRLFEAMERMGGGEQEVGG